MREKMLQKHFLTFQYWAAIHFLPVPTTSNVQFLIIHYYGEAIQLTDDRCICQWFGKYENLKKYSIFLFEPTNWFIRIHLHETDVKINFPFLLCHDWSSLMGFVLLLQAFREHFNTDSRILHWSISKLLLIL